MTIKKNALSKINWSYIVIAGSFFLYWYNNAHSIDPDLGWHLRMGQYILQHGIPKNDPLSYSMPSYFYIYHDWLQNIIIYLLFQYVGNIITAGIYALLGVLPLVVIYRAMPKKRYLIPFLLTALSLYPFIGIRTQIINWLFFSVLILYISNKLTWQKYGYIIPIIMLIWTNLHGSFAMGIFVLFSALIFKSVSQRSISRYDFLIAAASLIVTFINPYGLSLWGEVWKQMFDQGWHWSINEWLPSAFYVILAFWFYITLSTILVFYFRKRLDKLQLFFFIIFTLACISSVRFVPVWAVFAFGITCEMLNLLKQEAADPTRFSKAYAAMGGLVALFILIQISLAFMPSSAPISSTFYPEQAVAYLKKHPQIGQIFSVYDWGGYLDWYLPEKRVFIDGRMPSWHWSAHIKGESDNAYSDFRSIRSGILPVSSVIKTYHISTFLLPVQKPKKKSVLENLLNELSSQRQRQPDVYEQLKKLQWTQIYIDSTAVIYQMPNR